VIAGACGSDARFKRDITSFGDSLAKMVVDPAGEVGIGVAAPLDRLDVNGDVRVGTSGTNGCVKNNTGTGILGVCSSNLRFKREITSSTPSLDRVAALRPVHYYGRSAEFPRKGFGDEQAYGLVAQEVVDVLPELVSTDADGYQAVDYAKLPLLAIQAVEELKAASDELKTENDALRERNTDLERRVSALGERTTAKR